MSNENSRVCLRTTSGYPLTLTDCVDSDIVSLSVAGNAVQDGTPTPDAPVDVVGVGDRTANLLDWSSFIDFNNWKHDEYGETAGGMFRFKIDVKPGIKYLIMFKNECDKINILLYGSNKTTIQTNKTYQIETDKDYFYISANVYNQSKVDELAEIVGGVMLLEGTYTVDTIPEYEPYGYYVPIKCRGQNLFDVSKVISDGAVSDNGITANNTDFFLKAGTYTLQFTVNTECTVFLRKGQVSSGYFSQLKPVADVPTIVSFTFDTDTYLRITTFATDITFYNIQILEGSYTAETMPPYEPYYHDTVNIYTDKPLYGIDNYTDSIALDFENRTAVRTDRVKEIVLHTNNVYRVCNDVVRFNCLANPNSYNGARMMCNELPCLSENTTGFSANSECIFMHNSAAHVFYFSLNKTRIGADDTDTNDQLIEKANAYLADNPITAYYKIRGTGIETDISDTIDWDNLSLHIQKGTNIITATSTVEATGITTKHYSTRLYNTNYLKRRHMILMNNIKFKGYLRTTSGYPLTLTDCVDSDVMSLSVAGNAVQDGRPTPDAPVDVVGVGDRTANLLYKSDVVLGQKLSCAGVGYIWNNMGGATYKYSMYFKNYDVKPSTAYTMINYTRDTYWMSRIIECDENDLCTRNHALYTLDDSYDDSKNKEVYTFTTQAETKYMLIQYIRIDKADVTEDDIDKLHSAMLEGTYTTSTMPKYEPYGYHVPIELHGQNLYSVDKMESFRAYNVFDLKSNTKYTASIRLRDGYDMPNGCYVGFIHGGNTGNVSASWLVNNGAINKTIVVASSNAHGSESDKRFTFGFYTGLNVTVQQIDEAFEINLVEGSYSAETMPPYEPYYHDTINVCTDKLLYGIGDYRDSITLDFENRTAVRTDVIKEFTLTGLTGSQTSSSNDYTAYYIVNYNFNSMGLLKNSSIMCDMLPFSATTHYAMGNYIGFGGNPALLYISIANSLATTIDEASQLLDGAKCYMPMSEPIETDISDTIDWDRLPPHLKKGTNIITSTATTKPMSITTKYYSTKEA